MNNTIILQRGESRLTETEYRRFSKGDTIFGENSNPQEIQRWPIEQKDMAIAEMGKYRCSYEHGIALYNIVEYALEYCLCDEDGEFVDGSDYDLAEELR